MTVEHPVGLPVLLSWNVDDRLTDVRRRRARDTHHSDSPLAWRHSCRHGSNGV